MFFQSEERTQALSFHLFYTFLAGVIIYLGSQIFLVEAATGPAIIEPHQISEDAPAMETATTTTLEIRGDVFPETKGPPSLEVLQSQYQAVEVTATGYYAGKESTGKEPGHPEYGITYSGLKVKRDPQSISTIAADPNTFPLGTILYIPDYGYGIVADIGSAVKGHTIDLYFETIDDVFSQWGKKTLDVYVIEQGDGHLTEAVFQEKLEIYS